MRAYEYKCICNKATKCKKISKELLKRAQSSFSKFYESCEGDYMLFQQNLSSFCGHYTNDHSKCNNHPQIVEGKCTNQRNFLIAIPKRKYFKK